MLNHLPRCHKFDFDCFEIISNIYRNFQKRSTSTLNIAILEARSGSMLTWSTYDSKNTWDIRFGVQTPSWVSEIEFWVLKFFGIWFQTKNQHPELSAHTHTHTHTHTPHTLHWLAQVGVNGPPRYARSWAWSGWEGVVVGWASFFDFSRSENMH